MTNAVFYDILGKAKTNLSEKDIKLQFFIFFARNLFVFVILRQEILYMDNQNMNQQNNQNPNQQYQQSNQPPYGYQQQGGYNNYPTRRPRNPNDGLGLSIAALVLGVCGILFGWVFVFNILVLPCSILGIVFGAKGRRKSFAAYGKSSGMATAGFVLGIIGASICALGVLSCTLPACICSSCEACSMCAALESASLFGGLS